MKRNGTKLLTRGIILLAAFTLWTFLICTVDVHPIGPEETSVGFAALNHRFHEWTGIHMALYVITDWMGLVPLFICMAFGVLGLIQLIRRKSLLRVDRDLLLLGIYYTATIAAYIAFEIFPVNHRPILIEGRLEASYPSSTTLLVLCVMPTLVLQAQRRFKKTALKNCISSLSMIFCAFMITMRALSGVHWLTDIAGAILLSTGLFSIYRAVVSLYCPNPT